MQQTDQTPDFTDLQTAAYEAHIAAVQEYEDVRNRPGSTLFEQMVAARNMALKSSAMLDTFGGPGRNLSDVRKIEQLETRISNLVAVIRDSHALIYCANMAFDDSSETAGHCFILYSEAEKRLNDQMMKAEAA